MWACSISVHAVHFSNYKMKYGLLIGGIRLIRNFVVDWAKRQTELDARSVSLYGNVPLPFLEQVALIASIFYLSLLKMVKFLKMIHGCHSVPNFWVRFRGDGQAS